MKWTPKQESAHWHNWFIFFLTGAVMNLRKTVHQFPATPEVTALIKDIEAFDEICRQRIDAIYKAHQRELSE